MDSRTIIPFLLAGAACQAEVRAAWLVNPSVGGCTQTSVSRWCTNTTLKNMSDQSTNSSTEPKAWGLWVKPLADDLVNGHQHVNTKVESSSSTGKEGQVTLIKFTAEVTMGADLYAAWAKQGRFNMPVGWKEKAHTPRRVG